MEVEAEDFLKFLFKLFELAIHFLGFYGTFITLCCILGTYFAIKLLHLLGNLLDSGSRMFKRGGNNLPPDYSATMSDDKLPVGVEKKASENPGKDAEIIEGPGFIIYR
jgi:hypothetical protein